MDKNMKKAVLKNRVKLLSLDYFDVTAPLLASEIFPSKKHKEIKTQASDSKARVDLLLEWLEESAPKEAFPIFLNGIRNCKELILAKKIKREASGKESGPAVDGKPKPSGSSIPLDQLLAEIMPSLPASLPMMAAATAAAAAAGNKVNKKPRAPKPKTNLPPIPAPINGLPSTNLLPPPPPPVTKKRKAEGDAKQPKVKLPKPKTATTAPATTAAAGKSATPKTPKAKGAATKQNGTPRSDSRSGTPKTTAAALAAAAAAAAAKSAAAMAAAATPRATRKSSSSDTVQGKATPRGKVGKSAGKAATSKRGRHDKKETATGTGSAAGGTSPKRIAATKANPMTFKEVEDKQLDFKNKFRFTNANAVAKILHFKDKSDITYLGCPFLANNKMCGKKVELKSKEFICEAKHKSPNCRQIPRLLVTCSDGTADLALTLMKQNVEIFSGKSESDIETMTVDEIKVVLDKAVGRKLNIDVTSEKAKKQGVKKGAAVKWNNVATIVEESDEPPSKKKRKI